MADTGADTTMTTAADTGLLTGRTAWARNLATPVRELPEHRDRRRDRAPRARRSPRCCGRTRPWSHTYESVWTTQALDPVGGGGISADLRHWVNQGLMTLFFLVVGLEAKRELDVGELRERRRLAIPVVAAIGGMLVPVAIYLVFNAGGRGRTAGARRCRPTPRSRSARWRC